NPPEYNGLKLFGPDGRVIPAATGQEVIRRYREGTAAWVRHDQVGQIGTIAHPCLPHLKLVANLVNVKQIRERNFRVILDSNHGSGGTLGQLLLEELGCNFTLLAAKPTGHFVHPPEP